MSTVEKHQFQAEIQQLLNIVVHSLYTDKEIFIRELVSNAADACEKLRFLQTAGQAPEAPDTPLRIALTTDETAHTITVADSGIGMTHGELVENLGTIAHSGSKAFLKQIAENKKPDASLIGQFGVGFYSAFMTGKQVVVLTRSYRADEPGWKWTSDGSGTYDIEPAPEAPRGTSVTVHLKDEDAEFARAQRVEGIVRRYSNFVAFPIELNGKPINTVRAIWARSKSEITEQEYKEFYEYVGHDSEEPLYRLHFTADAPLAIQALLFVPPRNFETMGMARTESEVNLYCRKILIQSKASGLFPEWLRFLKGVVDSEDLPLNISRETMQDTALMQKLNRVLTGRFLKFLEEQSEKDPATYDKFVRQFGRFLKEGVATDFTHRAALGKLLRYESSAVEKEKLTSLAEYVKRMPSEQTEIFYLLAPNRAAAEASPYFEVFRARQIEVLFLDDPWDEFVMEHLREFDGKTLRSAEKAELKVENAGPADEQLTDAEAEELAKWMKESLADQLNDVKVSHRLVDSPAVVMDSDKLVTASMRRILKSLNPEAGGSKFDLEINPKHRVIARLNRMRTHDAALARSVSEQIYDNARAAAGLLEDPRSMVTRMNSLLERLLEAQPSKAKE